MINEDLEITKINHKLLALTEHPVWGEFVKIVSADMNELDSISSLILAGGDRDALVREVEVRYHTIEKIKNYLVSTIDRAETALEDKEEVKSDIINVVEP